MAKAQIEKFTNGLGETRFRFASPSIINKGELSRSLNSWRTRRAAREAARRSGYAI